MYKLNQISFLFKQRCLLIIQRPADIGLAFCKFGIRQCDVIVKFEPEALGSGRRF